MANRAGKKLKKPLQTSLGKATCHSEKEVDLSHVQKPINTSIFGLRQVLSLFQTATTEVQNYITYECDLMYECRICRTIFRSLANFILHKRDYCRERFNQFDVINNTEEVQEHTNSQDVEDTVDEDSPSIPPDRKDTHEVRRRKSLLPVIDKLKERQEISQLTKKVLSQDLSSNEGKKDCTESQDKNDRNDVLLEEIASNNAAVFQTVLRKLPKRNTKRVEFMKSEVMEIHGILDSDEAVLGPDGKICSFKTNKINRNPIIPENTLICTECNLKFSTKKTLTYHIKYKHNNTRLVFVCPDCKDTFANAWCVYRHLFKIHRRTSAQIKRMREQIHNNCVRKDQEPIKKSNKKFPDKMEKTDEENQWLSNIEGDNDFQMCGGCGKRFERKAALHSHAQMCTKRIAVCNTIKENNAKKKEEEVCKDSKTKTNKIEKVEVLKGSSKRKPYLLRTYKASDENQSNRRATQGNDYNKACDVNANSEIIETIRDNTDILGTEVTHVGISCLSISEDPSSPSKMDFVSSPSIEKIDTEKMLHIIGITKTNDENEPTSKSPSGIKTAASENDNSKEKCKSHTATDFDLFCQSVANSLITDVVESTSGEVEDIPQRSIKTVPLILRRRKNSKCERRNSILERSIETSSQNDESSKRETECDKKDFIEIEKSAQTNNSQEINKSPSSSTFKISVKSLEDLIGVSPKDHMKNSEIREIDEDIQDATNELNVVHNTTPKEIFDPVNTNVSPEELNNKYLKCLKRKRTSSFDFADCDKLEKNSKGPFSSKQDTSFISKASPFMDQNKLLCIPCQMNYPSLSKLLWHMSAHFSWFRFQCSRCSFISFNKMDCANHARKVHFVKKASIQSVVLPIPNWKTVLMSHDFCMLSDENDLSGKHTDEILSGNPEEAIVINHSDERVENYECEKSEWTNTLFLESRSLDCEEDIDPLEPDIPINLDGIKQENIDIVDDNQESFQIEVPQEIYTFNISELIEGINYEERYDDKTSVKIEQIDDEDNISNFISLSETSEALTDGYQPEIAAALEVESSTEEVISKTNEVSNIEDQECFQQSEENIHIRPTRNRTKSIKTLQDDFFYDLSKVIKLNDTSNSKSNTQKQKRAVSHKNTTSCNGKGDTQPIRVYAKRK